MTFDYKREYKEFYLPKNAPTIIEIPPMNYISVKGEGDPNYADGDYKKAIELLYGIAFTLKMSKKGDYKIKGYFDYVVPPLEGFWWQEGAMGVDYSSKNSFKWISVIRVPDFIARVDFEWAKIEAERKKRKDFSKVEFMTYNEGLCVQCMHIGSYNSELVTVELMHEFMTANGYELDFKDRLHHEIYLSDPRKCAENRCKTVIRHPIKTTQGVDKNDRNS